MCEYGIVARLRTSVGFKLAAHDTGAGGLVAPLPCRQSEQNMYFYMWLYCAFYKKFKLCMYRKNGA